MSDEGSRSAYHDEEKVKRSEYSFWYRRRPPSKPILVVQVTVGQWRMFRHRGRAACHDPIDVLLDRLNILRRGTASPDATIDELDAGLLERPTHLFNRRGRHFRKAVLFLQPPQGHDGNSRVLGQRSLVNAQEGSGCAYLLGRDQHDRKLSSCRRIGQHTCRRRFSITPATTGALTGILPPPRPGRRTRHPRSAAIPSSSPAERAICRGRACRRRTVLSAFGRIWPHPRGC